MKYLTTSITKLVRGVKKTLAKDVSLSSMSGLTLIDKSKSDGQLSRFANTITESSSIKTEETSKKNLINGIQSTEQHKQTSRVTLGSPGYRYKPF